jgi:hypothetical protein
MGKKARRHRDNSRAGRDGRMTHADVGWRRLSPREISEANRSALGWRITCTHSHTRAQNTANQEAKRVQKVCGLAGNRTQDLSHALDALHRLLRENYTTKPQALCDAVVAELQNFAVVNICRVFVLPEVKSSFCSMRSFSLDTRTLQIKGEESILATFLTVVEFNDRITINTVSIAV